MVREIWGESAESWESKLKDKSTSKRKWLSASIILEYFSKIWTQTGTHLWKSMLIVSFSYSEEYQWPNSAHKSWCSSLYENQVPNFKCSTQNSPIIFLFNLVHSNDLPPW